MSKRVIFGKDRSLYLNIPKDVADDAGFKEKDCVDVRFVDGVGIVVAMPILMPRIYDKDKRCRTFGVWKSGKKVGAIKEEYCEVIPLFNSIRRIK